MTLWYGFAPPLVKMAPAASQLRWMAALLLLPVIYVATELDCSQNKSCYQNDYVDNLEVRHDTTSFAFVHQR